jgi:hypothetical protein
LLKGLSVKKLRIEIKNISLVDRGRGKPCVVHSARGKKRGGNGSGRENALLGNVIHISAHKYNKLIVVVDVGGLIALRRPVVGASVGVDQIIRDKIISPPVSASEAKVGKRRDGGIFILIYMPCYITPHTHLKKQYGY